MSLSTQVGDGGQADATTGDCPIEPPSAGVPMPSSTEASTGNQTSADAHINGAYNGAFTYYLCKHIRDTQGAITRAELLKRLRASLRHEGYDQTPQIECPAAWKKKKVLA